MSRHDTWMPLYVGDYLRDTGHLTTIEHGAYLLLLMQAWTRDGALPADDNRLRTLARMSPAEWKASRDTILEFFERDGDCYRQQRLTEELENAKAMTEQRRGAGRASAEARAKKRRDNGSSNEPINENPTTVERALQREGQQKTRPSQSQEEERAEAIASDAGASPTVPNARDTLWAEGLPILERMIGKPPSQCRSVLGRLLRDVQDDCPRALCVLREAEQLRPADPLAWITRAAAPQSGRPARPATNGAIQLVREAAARGEKLAEIPW